MGTRDQERLFVNQKAIRNETNNSRSDKKYPGEAFHGADLDMRPLRQLKTYTIELVCEHELEALLGNQLPLTVEFQVFSRMPCSPAIQMFY